MPDGHTHTPAPMTPIVDRRMGGRVSAGPAGAVAPTVSATIVVPEPFQPEAFFYAPAGSVRIHATEGGRARMSTHLFTTHMRFRNDHDNPEAFLTVAGAILTALVILIALAAVAVASGAVARG
jgi:hypothetical protein